MFQEFLVAKQAEVYGKGSTPQKLTVQASSMKTTGFGSEETPKSSRASQNEDTSSKSGPSGRQRKASEASPAAVASLSPEVQKDSILLAIRSLFQKEFMPRIEGE
jgi:hypothetical protein